jgi:hypothetical protein
MGRAQLLRRFFALLDFERGFDAFFADDAEFEACLAELEEVLAVFAQSPLVDPEAEAGLPEYQRLRPIQSAG